MNLKKLLREMDFSVSAEEMNYLKSETEKIVGLLKKESGRNAEVFVGGSFAKGTLTKSENYDVDIFVRFSKNKDLSSELEKIIRKVAKAMRLNYERLHGSRDYFRVMPSKKLTFEIIPVLKIRKVKEAGNVTDLSYFHVNYIRKKLAVGRREDVGLAKQFCKALGVYGAESYINGFSGYALECLIVYYGSFEKMVGAMTKIKEKEIIDIERFYRQKSDVLVELNESKTSGPIVLIDPTWKERNVLAALNWDSFKKFQEGARKVIKKPTREMFLVKKIDVSSLEKFAGKKGAEFVHVRLETDRQEGDIAGTKLKKFAGFLSRELEKYFIIMANEFSYSGGKIADVYFVVKTRGEIIRNGPPVKLIREVREFKKRNRRTFVRSGKIFARVKVGFGGAELVEKLGRSNGVEMGIVKVLLAD
ncbi:nucleotidyltransferase domain-containing protein [Candidatus Pacearchaeota archaeon]|nr:nucleotidyltransferase domain-containing protein [Candidatus Pacearchaeota archaeon]